MKPGIKKSIAQLLSILLILNFVIYNNVYAESNIIEEPSNIYDINILTDTDEELIIEGKVDEVTATLTFNKTTSEITVQTNEVLERNKNEEAIYTVEAETITEDTVIATFVDTEDGEVYHVNTDELQASFAFVIPIGIVIGSTLLAHLASIGLAIVISGVTYIAYSEFTKRNRTYSHYMASRQDKGLFIGNGLSASNATKRLKAGNDTWSNSSMGAKGIAKDASIYSKTIGAEIDKYGVGKHYHYHPVTGYTITGVSIRGAHAFYGAPRN